jgi:hypothetical protein
MITVILENVILFHITLTLVYNNKFWLGKKLILTNMIKLFKMLTIL